MLTIATTLWLRLSAPAAQRPDDERGASLVEYALLVALIALVCIAAVTQLGGTVSSRYAAVGSSLA